MSQAGETAAPSAQKDDFRAFWGVFALIVCVYLALAFYKLGEMPLLDPDEPRYAGAARTMYRGGNGNAEKSEIAPGIPSGSLLIPEFNGEPRINKPPLFYWITALSDAAFGHADEFTARVPGVLLGLLTLCGTMLLGRSLFSSRTGLLAGMALASMPLFVAISRTCITDMTLSAFVSGGLACVLLTEQGQISPKKGAWLAGFILGLAMLTKATPVLAAVLAIVIDRAMRLPKSERPGAMRFIPWLLGVAILLSGIANWIAPAKQRTIGPPPLAATIDPVLTKIALALCLIIVALLIVAAWRASKRMTIRYPAIGPLALAVMMVLWWYGALIVKFGYERFQHLLTFEVAGRLAGSVHREAMSYYLLNLPLLIFPWTIFLAGAIYCAWPKSQDQESAPADEQADRFLLAWVLGIVFFFSIPGAKIATYMLPALPALALITARFVLKMADALKFQIPRWTLNLTLVLSLLINLILIVVAIIVCFTPHVMPKDARDWVLTIGPNGKAIFIFLTIGVPLGYSEVRYGRSMTGSTALFCTIALVSFIGLDAAMPALQKRSSKALVAEIGTAVDGVKRVAALGKDVESLSYYFDVPVNDMRTDQKRLLKQEAAAAAKSPQNDDTDDPKPETGGRNPGAKARYLEQIKDELARAEPTAILIDYRFCKLLELDLEKGAPTDAEVKEKLSPNAARVFSNKEVLVIRRATVQNVPAQ